MVRPQPGPRRHVVLERADFNTSNVYEFNIATGAIEHMFNTGTPSGTVFGLSVFGEITQAKSTDLAINMTGSPDPVSVGQNLTYTMTVTNNGPNDSSGSTVVDTLPAGVTYVSSSGGTFDLGTNTVTFNDGPLANGSSTTLTIVVQPTSAVAGTMITNTATVTSNEGDPNPNNNTATVTTTVNQAQATPVQPGLTATIGFWHNQNGQALINKFGVTSTNLTLGQWLATTFPNLYGGANGAPNLSSDTDAQVAAFYLTLFNTKGQKLDAQVLDTALDVFATTSSLGGSAAIPYGFTVNAFGLGAYSWNIGSSGAAFGVPNGTTLNVYQILQAANNSAVAGEPWDNNTFLPQPGQHRVRRHQPGW